MVGLTGCSVGLIFCFLCLDVNLISELSSCFRLPFEGFFPGTISMLRTGDEDEEKKRTQNGTGISNFRRPVRVTDDGKRLSLPAALAKSKLGETKAHMPRKEISLKVSLFSP